MVKGMCERERANLYEWILTKFCKHDHWVTSKDFPTKKKKKSAKKELKFSL